MNRNYLKTTVKSMMKILKNKIINAMIHLPLDAGINPIVGSILGFLGLFQLIAVLTDGSAQIHLATSWSDTNVYISTPFTVITGTVLTILYITCLIVRIVLTENDEILLEPTACLKYVGTVLAYLRAICQSIVFGPYIISCLKTFLSPSSQGILGVAIGGLVIFLLIVYPISLYCSTDTTYLTPNGDRKFSLLNAEFLINIYKISLISVAVLNQPTMLFLTPIFFALYVLTILKRPYYCYAGQSFKRGNLSVVAFFCVSRAFNAIVQNPKGSVLVEIGGAISFAFLIEWVSLQRLKMIMLEQQKPSINQIKILLMMIANLQSYQQNLEQFIFKHHKTCSNSECKCRQVIDHLTNKQTDLLTERIWFQFAISYIQGIYDLKKMQKLSQIELKEKIQKYEQIVFDIAEIHLFKLNQLNAAFLTVSQYKKLIEGYGFEDLWNQRRNRVFVYYLQQANSERFNKQQSINHNPDKYLDFQVEYTKYLKMMLVASQQTGLFWSQLTKRDPHEPTLLQDVTHLDKCNKAIKSMYKTITSSYSQSRDIMDPITKDYFDMVLNTSQNQPLNIVNKNNAKKDNGKRQEDNTKLYSFESSTPMCLVSVESQSCGKISFSNNFFDEVVTQECGKISCIDDLILPQMAEWHQRKMQSFVQGDSLTLEHKNNFILTAKRNILSCQMFIQIVPSVTEGLKYALFLKETQPKRRILISKSNSFEIMYNSDSFQNLIDKKLGYQIVIDAFEEAVMEQLRDRKQIELTIGEELFAIRVISQIQIDSEKSLMVLQFVGGDDLEMSRLQKTYNSRLIEREQVKQTDRNTTKTASIFKRQLKNEQQNIDKNETQLKSVFLAICQNEQSRAILKRIKTITILGSIIIIAILIALIFVKKNNQTIYDVLWKNNEDYHSLMNNIGQSSTNLELLNLYSSQTTANQPVFAALTQSPSIIGKLDSFFSIYNPADYTKDWSFLTLNTNSSFSLGTLNNHKVVSDSLQTPLTLLSNSYTQADFAFPIAFEYLTPPLTLIQQQFHTFITNALYYVLPSLRSLKQELNAGPFDKNMQNSLPIIILNIVILLTTLAVLILTLFFSYKILKARVTACSCLEVLPFDLADLKMQNCQTFTNKYAYFVSGQQNRMKGINPYEINSFAMSRNASKADNEPGNARNGSTSAKPFEDSTLRDLNLKSSSYGMREKRYLDDYNNSDKKGQRKKQSIFSHKSYVPFSFKLFLFCLPLMAFTVTWCFIQKHQNKQLKTLLTFQYEAHKLQEEVSELRLYLMHYGVSYQPLNQYKNMTLLVKSKTTKIFASMRALQQSSSASQYQLTSNLCDLERSGLYSGIGQNFAQRGNFGSCSLLSSGILTQGYQASLLLYAQTASQLFNNNPQTTAYNQTQKTTYLSNTFFTQTVKIIDYLNLHLEWIVSQTNTKVQNKSTLYRNTWIYLSIALVVLSLVVLVVLGPQFMKALKKDISFIACCYGLVSYRSIVSEEKLREQFVLNRDRLNDIK